jgi:hypothetical protein
LLRHYRVNFIADSVPRIQLVPGDEWSVTASIRPHEQRTEAEKENLRAYRWSQNPDELQLIIAEASQRMGVGTGEGQALFSQDVLQIVVRGPDTQRLTLVDVPGLIAVNISSGNEVKMVEDITHSYISKPNAIILAIVNADADPSDHKITDMAKDVDPSAQRTFGIITKPDLPAAGLETEQAWLRIIRRPDLSTHFKKGAHVLLNGTGRQVQNSNWSMKERDENEESFFAVPVHKSGQNNGEDNAWHALYKGDLWGIKSLRKRLTELLFEHTQRQLPNVHQDIELRLREYNHALEQLGVVWKDPETLKRELRSTLYKMASVTDHGSKGTFATYDGFFDFQKRVRWLRSRIRDDSENFRQDMEKNGHDTEFAWAPDSEQPEDHKQAVEKYYQVIKDTKGPELAGNIDSIKLTLLFKVYSKQWQSLARIYVNSAYNHCDKFIQEVVEVHMHDALAAMVGRLQSMVLKPILRDRRDLAMKELELLEFDRNGPAITEDVQFWTKNSERQRKRFIEMSDDVKKLKANNSALTDESISKALNQDTEESVQREAALGLIRQMLIYYEVRSQMPLYLAVSLILNPQYRSHGPDSLTM